VVVAFLLHERGPSEIQIAALNGRETSNAAQEDRTL